jgi:phospholipid/cholesterol/gamma-HCH transport system ATP-binding protein
MAQNEAHITVQDLTMAYGAFVIQRDLNFTVQRGDIFIIMGASGCGKSTLLKHMIDLLSPAKGDILYSGESFWTADLATQDQLRRRFGVMYQSGALWSSIDISRKYWPAVRRVYRSEPAAHSRACLAQAGLSWFSRL